MKYRAPEYADDDDDGASDDSHGGGGDQRKATGDCPSQLSDERTELLELQWRDGCPVEEPVHDHRSSDNDEACGASPPGEKKSKAEGGPKDATMAGEAVEEWWRLWREGESGGCAAGAAAAHGYPQLVDDLSSVNAKAATASVGPKQQTRTAADEETADELWRMWREGHGSSAPQDSSCKNSVLKGEESLLPSPSSAASRGSGGAQRHLSEQIDQQCSTLDHAIEYMKSLQQQIQVLSSGGYGMQPLLFPCICSQTPHTGVAGAPAPAAPLYPELPPPPPGAAAAPLCRTPPLPPQPAGVAADLNPVMVGIRGPPGAISLNELIGINAGVADEMASSTSEIPFGGCARCSFRRHAAESDC